MKSMATDLYKQQSNMLHEWIKNNEGSHHDRSGIQFTILSSENGKKQLSKITCEIASSHNKEDVDIQFLDTYIHGSI